MSIDLYKLNTMIDEALNKETKESLMQWLYERRMLLLNKKIAKNFYEAYGWQPHPETTPDKIDEKYKVRLKDGTETEDYFTGFNWYYYDYTEIVAWKPTFS